MRFPFDGQCLRQCRVMNCRLGVSTIYEALEQEKYKDYDSGALYRCLRFYKLFPEIVASVGQQSHILRS